MGKNPRKICRALIANPAKGKPLAFGVLYS